jgi:hypothetical protein
MAKVLVHCEKNDLLYITRILLLSDAHLVLGGV